MTNPVQDLEAELRSAKNPDGHVKPLQRFYDTCEELLESHNSTLACKDKCSFCCYLHVNAKPHEIFAIVDYIERNFTSDEIDALMERLREHKRVTEPLTTIEYQTTNIPCPLLVDDSCSVHSARPFMCRRYHSLDVKTCEHSYKNPQDTAAMNPTIQERLIQWQGASDAAAQAYQRTSHRIDAVELGRGLLNALTNPKSRKRWVRGNSPLLNQ